MFKFSNVAMLEYPNGQVHQMLKCKCSSARMHKLECSNTQMHNDQILICTNAHLQVPKCSNAQMLNQTLTQNAYVFDATSNFHSSKWYWYSTRTIRMSNANTIRDAFMENTKRKMQLASQFLHAPFHLRVYVLPPTTISLPLSRCGTTTRRSGRVNSFLPPWRRLISTEHRRAEAAALGKFDHESA